MKMRAATGPAQDSDGFDTWLADPAGGPSGPIVAIGITGSFSAAGPIAASGGAIVSGPAAVKPATAVSGSAPAPSWIATLNDAVLRADMTAASAGGTVTEAAMAKLFTDLGTELSAAATTLSASQFVDLKTIAADLNVGETASAYVTYITNAFINGNAANAKWTGGSTSTTTLGNLAVGATATHVNELDGQWFLGTNLPGSSVAMTGENAFKITYSAVTSPLFGTSGPTMNDINQGCLGDCYLLASLAEVAKQEPSLIQSMITDNGNNTYGVRFFVGGSAEYVTVNNELAGGGTVFNSATDDWASLVEKAYAQAQANGPITGNSINDGNSFSTIANGGAPEWALEEITGATVITDFVANGSSWSKYLYNDTISYQSGSSGIATASALATLVADLADGYDVVLSSDTNAVSNGKDTLIADHSMSIYGYDSATGDLEVRNPWGTEIGQYWDTTFEIGLGTLLADGDMITTANATATPPSIVLGGLVTAAAGLQANAQVTGFTIADTAANVLAGLAGLGADSKLTAITLADLSVPSITVTMASYTADAAVLALIVSPYRLTVTGALAAAAAALQTASAVTSFTVSDSSANVIGAIAGLAADTKLLSITLTDAATLSLTYAQFTTSSFVLAKLPSNYMLIVTAAPVSAAAALQANSHVKSFTVDDSAANVTAGLTSLSGDAKLTSISLTDTATPAVTLTSAQFSADTGILAKVASAYTLAVTQASTASAAGLQANGHVGSFSVSDTAANITSALTAMSADSKLSSLNVTGTAATDKITLTGSRVAATIALGGDTANVAAGLNAASLSFIGTPDSIVLGTGAATIGFTLQAAGGIETIANFQYGHDALVINLSGAANAVLKAANTTVAGVGAISIYSSADPGHGVVMLGMTSAATMLSSHTTFNAGQVTIT